MGKVLAGITISVDGFITGPGDGPGCGLGVGGERLHYWVFGGPWSYDSPGRGEPAGQDRAWLEEAMGANGAVIAGRGTYEAAGHWGGKNPWGSKNPWGIPFFVVTHRPAGQPPGDGFVFAGSLAGAIDQARAAAGEKQVHVRGGADLIRRALAAGLAGELTIIIAPVTLGAGKRLSGGFGDPASKGRKRRRGSWPDISNGRRHSSRGPDAGPVRMPQHHAPTRRRLSELSGARFAGVRTASAA